VDSTDWFYLIYEVYCWHQTINWMMMLYSNRQLIKNCMNRSCRWHWVIIPPPNFHF
jgi:hypothetical protein